LILPQGQDLNLKERLKSLMMLGCETDITDSINLDEIVDRWAKTRRLISVG
jgi:hypothetical protein